METEIGLERQCVRCGEWWPVDEEFFHRNRRGFHGFSGTCRACTAAKRGTRGYRTEIDEAEVRRRLASGEKPFRIARDMGLHINSVLRRRAA